jgi:hypothetical protein
MPVANDELRAGACVSSARAIGARGVPSQLQWTGLRKLQVGQSEKLSRRRANAVDAS